MKKKTVMIWMCMAVGIGALSGCAKTPESSLVKQKGQSSMKNYEEGESLEAQAEGKEKGGETAIEAENKEAVDMEISERKEETTEETTETENKLRLALNAPETYKSETSDETGKLKILTDAVVEIPNADKVSAINVSQHPFDQAAIDKITETFFPEATIYSAESWYTPTKAEIQKKLEELKGYVAEGNLDPFNHGTDENGDLFYNIYDAIQWTEQSYEEAPEERTLVEVKPQLDESGHFGGIAVIGEESTYRYDISSWNTYPMNVKIEKRYNGDDSVNGMWSEYDNIYAYNKGAAPEPEEVKENIGISFDQAKKTAEDKIEKLGLSFMELADWEYGILWNDGDLASQDNGGYSREKQLGYGYILHYTRKINDIPITCTIEQGGCLEEMDSVMETWAYEQLDFYISKDGIEKVDFNNQYDIGEVKTENLSLKSFEEIMEIFEKMMVITNADVLTHENYRTYNIDRITFGYTRIYEPASDSRSGILVPVWDFFGGFELEYEYEGEVGHSENVTKNQSYMTINAVDGSIIDRGLGY